MSNKVKDARGFYCIENALLKKHGKQLGPYGIAVYNALSMFANSDNQCFPSFNTIADLIGISRRKTVNVIDQLIALQIISVEHRANLDGSLTSNLYTLLVLRSESKQGGSAHGALGVVHEIHQGSAHGAPEQYPINKTHLNNTDDDDDRGIVFETLKKAGVYYSALQADQYNALIDELGVDPIVEGINIAAGAGNGKVQNIRYVERCARGVKNGTGPTTNGVAVNGSVPLSEDEPW